MRLWLRGADSFRLNHDRHRRGEVELHQLLGRDRRCRSAGSGVRADARRCTDTGANGRAFPPPAMPPMTAPTPVATPVLTASFFLVLAASLEYRISFHGNDVRLRAHQRAESNGQAGGTLDASTLVGRNDHAGGSRAGLGYHNVSNCEVVLEQRVECRALGEGRGRELRDGSNGNDASRLGS